MNRENRLRLLNNIDLYPVTCQELSNGRTNLEVLDAVLAGGVKIIQLREKDWSKKKIYELAVIFKKKIHIAFGTSVSIGHISQFTKLKSYNFNEDDDLIIPLYAYYSDWL